MCAWQFGFGLRSISLSSVDGSRQFSVDRTDLYLFVVRSEGRLHECSSDDMQRRMKLVKYDDMVIHQCVRKQSLFLFNENDNELIFCKMS